MFHYLELDPRPVSRERTLELLRSQQVLGVEVTVPSLADACSQGNIDPQHAGGDIGTSAAEASITWDISALPHGVVLATVRPDLDAVTAMAVLTLRQMGHKLAYEEISRVQEIGKDDRSPGEWKLGMPINVCTDIQLLKAISFDRDLSLFEKVARVNVALLTGTVPGADAVKERLIAERAEHQAVSRDVLTVGPVAYVESGSRFAVMSAYDFRDVVVAVDPAHTANGRFEPHRKVTVCQARSGLVDLIAVRDELNSAEEDCGGDPSWGGSPVIIGSPQGTGSRLSAQFIIQTVKDNVIYGLAPSEGEKINETDHDSDCRAGALHPRRGGLSGLEAEAQHVRST